MGSTVCESCRLWHTGPCIPLCDRCPARHEWPPNPGHGSMWPLADNAQVLAVAELTGQQAIEGVAG